jgi:hypothetical protein
MLDEMTTAMTPPNQDDVPTPEGRALDGCDGIPVELADGATWLLREGGLLNPLDDLRDKIDDQARLAGSVPLDLVAEAALHLLLANYDLTAREAWRLLGGAIDQDLADAVFVALFGERDGKRGYTSWAASALYANGIDPASIPTSMLPHVLDQLERTRRCVPRDEFIASAEAGRRLAGIRATAARQAAERAPAPAGA